MVTLSTLLVITLLTPINSVTASEPTNYLTTEEQFYINEFAEDLEFLFEEGTTFENGKYTMNEQLVAKKFGTQNMASIALFIKIVNDEEITSDDLIGVSSKNDINLISSNSVVTMASKQSWKQCVGSKIIDATGIGFISGGLWKLIEREAWKQVAIELAKVAGKNAIKGGIIGFTASLAWYGIKCK